MTGNALAKVRFFFVRGLAVLAVIVTYAIGTIGPQVAAGVGISALALPTSTTSAEAWWRRGFRRRRVVCAPPRRAVFARRSRWGGGWGHRSWWGGGWGGY